MTVLAGQKVRAADLRFIEEQVFTADAGTDTTGSLANWPATTHSTDVPSWATRAVVTVAVNYATVTSATEADVNTDLDGTDKPTRSIGGGATDSESGLSWFDEFDVTGIAGTTVTVKTEAIETSGSGALRNRRRDISIRYYP